jgi:uncharacterized protein YggE
MKNLSGFLAAIVGVSVLWSSLNGQQAKTIETEPGVITVTGDAAVKVVPDEVLLTLGVETWHRELSAAKRQNDERVKDVLALAERFGIDSKNIQTDYINIEPRYDDSYGDGYFRQVLEGYFVRKSIVLTLSDISKFDGLLTAVTEAGTTNVHGIEFRTTELRQHRDTARALATKAAREKAEAIAQELGISVGQPKSIQEDRVGWWSWYGYGWWGSRYSGMAMQNVIQNVSGDPPDIEGAFAPGQISVTARVTVTFELQG